VSDTIANDTAELLRAGPTVGLNLANRALGISRAHGYALVRRGDYPVRVLRLGTSHRVVTSDLLDLLGLGAS
jgi:hypothetical protein